jgi:hypothetical protein
MKSLLHILSVTLDILGSIGCLGLMWLIKSAYSAATTTIVSGRIVEWVKEELEQGRAVRYRARLAYTDHAGSEHMAISTDTSFDTDLPKYPLKQPVKVSYLTKEPAWAQLADSSMSRWGVPVVMLVSAAICFSLATKLGG